MELFYLIGKFGNLIANIYTESKLHTQYLGCTPNTTVVRQKLSTNFLIFFVKKKRAHDERDNIKDDEEKNRNDKRKKRRERSRDRSRDRKDQREDNTGHGRMDEEKNEQDDKEKKNKTVEETKDDTEVKKKESILTRAGILWPLYVQI